MQSDTSFDGIASAFEDDVYGAPKGHVRLEVLWTDLATELPAITRGGLSVLDAGGGAGHMAVRLAQAGNSVVLCDASREMLRLAEVAIRAVKVEQHVSLIHGPIQELHNKVDTQFDLILCHAVLEWVADPQAVLGHLRRFLQPNGHLSLLFYNRNAALQRRIFRGEYADARRELDDGCGLRSNGCTPLAESTVRQWLGNLQLTVRSKAGIRIFHDFVPESVRSAQRLGDLIEVERAYRRAEPFASLGHHLHLVCESRRNEP